MGHYLDAVKAINRKRSKIGAESVRAGDNCTLSPDWDRDFSACCQKHDQGYMNGALTRLECDQNLRRCIQWVCAKNNLPSCLPFIYFWGVRMFGASRYRGFEPYRYEVEWWM